MSEDFNDLPDRLVMILATLQAQARGDHRGAMDGLLALAEGGPRAVYAACCVWAEAMIKVQFEPATRALEPDAPDARRRRGWGMGVLDERGEMLEPESAEPDMVWAMRFITAQANEDSDMTLALFDALPEEEGPRYLWALLSLTAVALSEEGR